MNAHGPVLTAAYNLLNVNVTGFAVYKMDVPQEETGNYIVLRIEGGTGANDKRSINDEVVLITDIVTRFENNVDSSVVDTADAVVFGLLIPTPQSHSLGATGLQVLNVRRENFDYLQESDGVRSYLRKLSRYAFRIHQTT